MKKKFEKPTLETCEFVVAARLEGSGVMGIGHSNGQKSVCNQVASNGNFSCAPPSTSQSSIGNSSC